MQTFRIKVKAYLFVFMYSRLITHFPFFFLSKGWCVLLFLDSLCHFQQKESFPRMIHIISMPFLTLHNFYRRENGAMAHSRGHNGIAGSVKPPSLFSQSRN